MSLSCRASIAVIQARLRRGLGMATLTSRALDEHTGARLRGRPRAVCRSSQRHGPWSISVLTVEEVGPGTGGCSGDHAVRFEDAVPYLASACAETVAVYDLLAAGTATETSPEPERLVSSGSDRVPDGCTDERREVRDQPWTPRGSEPVEPLVERLFEATWPSAFQQTRGKAPDCLTTRVLGASEVPGDSHHAEQPNNDGGGNHNRGHGLPDSVGSTSGVDWTDSRSTATHAPKTPAHAKSVVAQTSRRTWPSG